MRNGFHWPLTAFLLTVTTVVLVIVTVNERRRHAIDVQTLELKLREVSRDELPRFKRRILSSDEPIIFIGGIPRSGTTLMRAMLDAHPDIRCGEETSIIPAVLYLRGQWATGHMVQVANLSGITQQTLDDATSAFISEIIAEHGPMAPRLCNKDPYTAAYVDMLTRAFPNSKHILMIRDARATVHSIVDRKVPVIGFNQSDFQQMFTLWNYQITSMFNMCEKARGSCLKVYYERLVQRTEDEARRILKFIDVPWSEDVLRHQDKVGKEVKLNPNEFSTSQVKEKIYKKALTSWFGYYSNEILQNLDKMAPMLRQLGYDTSAHEPNYTKFAEDDFYEKYLA